MFLGAYEIPTTQSRIRILRLAEGKEAEVAGEHEQMLQGDRGGVIITSEGKKENTGKACPNTSFMQ